MTKSKKLSAKEICNTLKLTLNTRSYILHKYKTGEYSEKEWKENLKKDKLKF